MRKCSKKSSKKNSIPSGNSTAGTRPTVSLQCVFLPLLISLLSFSLSLSSSCSRDDTAGATASESDDLLFAVNDSALSLSWVVGRIPPGLPPEDSLRLFNRIVEDWTLDMILASLPEDQIPDSDEIERKVARYRRRLRLISWKKEMNEKAMLSISEDSLRAYVKAHPDEFVLEAPVVRGMLVRVQADSQIAGQLRQWVSDGSGEAVDNIERASLSAPFQFYWFGDRWVGIDEVQARIPGRLPDSPSYLASAPFLERKVGGSLYLLRILGSLPAGAPMPGELAFQAAAERMRSTDIAEFQRDFIRTQLEYMRRNGALRVGSLDPLSKSDHLFNPK